jgi:anthranilate synthase component II
LQRKLFKTLEAMGKILIIDNYDSFTYNLVHCIEKLSGYAPVVFRNDEIEIEEVDAYDRIILSPGPGVPSDAGICIDIIKRYCTTKNILGVCLGHQAIGEAFGGRLLNLDSVFHGVGSPVIVTDTGNPLFRNLPVKFAGGRYHSWVVSETDLPECLKITCTDENGLIMGITHRQYNVSGLQFHPESVLTEYGTEILSNWLNN